MKIAVGSDHAGYELKEAVKKYLAALGVQVEDMGTAGKESVDYPDFAGTVAGAVSQGRADRGILTCHTGVGVSIAANKFRGIRAALAWNPEIARLSRRHNTSNVLCLAAGYLDSAMVQEMVKIWLETPFDGGRHQRRIDKITQLEHIAESGF